MATVDLASWIVHWRTGARRVGVAAALIVACTFAGCKPKQAQLQLTPPANAPDASAIIAAHNERVAKLATTYSDGVIELTWRDDRGKHFESGDLDLWQTTGNRTALRVSKLGDVYLWLGSNEDEYWLFDLLNKDDRVLYRGRHAQAGGRGPGSEDTSGPGPLQGLSAQPLALLDLLALTPIRVEGAPDAPPPSMEWDPKRKTYVIEAPGRGGEGTRVRLFFDHMSLLPVRVELISSAGEILAESSHSNYESAEMRGVAPLARPKMAEIIDIRRGNDAAPQSGGGTAVTGEIKIAINTTTAYGDEPLPERYFDLNRLIAAMRPDRVEQTMGVPVAEAEAPAARPSALAETSSAGRRGW